MTDEEKLVEEAKRDPSHVESEPKFVYFMQAKIGGPIKIGIAADPIKRKASVQTGYPYPLRITRVIVGWTYHEIGLHEAFDSVRLSGEWFLPHPVLAEFADAIPDDQLGGHRRERPGRGVSPDATAARADTSEVGAPRHHYVPPESRRTWLA